MLFRDEVAAARSNVRLEIFASDADAEAIAIAREGKYPASIATDITPEHLAHYFQRDHQHYRVSPELRSSIVFTVQDILVDPPFSRIDFLSCRNLLIYFQPEAQAKAITILHFALRSGGVLLLGRAETAGALADRFAIISKADRLYRRIGRTRPAELGFLFNDGAAARLQTHLTPHGPPPRQTVLSDLSHRLVMQHYIPAAVLINAAHECVFTFGATDRYLHVPPGAPTQNLLLLARPALRARLRAGIAQATRDNARVILPGGTLDAAPGERSFNIDIIPTVSLGEHLKLICFVDVPAPHPAGPAASRHKPARDEPGRIAALEHDLIATRQDLEDATTNLEIANEEQTAAHEEALSVQQEYQSTNEELLTSKEELQSLNEELTALNAQLQETLDRQRTASNDLQNVLYSTNVATVFLDMELHIRFFTPATKALFNVIPGDIGRPLADLTFFAADAALLEDARAVLHGEAVLEREINTSSGLWYMRRILPYRTKDGGIGGVVILFADITDRHVASDALRAATRTAELANLAKSRFLAAASHDLRQPLQTLTLLQSLLANAVEGEKAQKLVAKLDDMLGAMSGMLDTLLDINQIETGTVQPVVTRMHINDLLRQLRDQFAYHATESGITLRVMPCSLVVLSDPRLLEQMVRNLLSNALKYTKRGRVLLGCRRHGDTLLIEVWDTGVGIPAAELSAIFDEYHQLDNPARQRSRGLGLGLSIVRRLADLLQHRIVVRSRIGRGSFFGIEVALAPNGGITEETLADPIAPANAVPDPAAKPPHILVIEDDPALRDTLVSLLEDAGFATSAAASGIAAFDLVAHGKLRADLILSDYNLPGGMDGLQVTARMRERLHRQVPAIILTGDISTTTLHDIQRMNCLLLRKPVKIPELTAAIHRLLNAGAHAAAPDTPAIPIPSSAVPTPVIYVIDDDEEIRLMLRAVLEDCGHTVVDFGSTEAFLAAARPPGPACLLVDAYLPGMSGIALLRRLQGTQDALPAIMITGNSDVAMAVEAMKAGAIDFIQKPIGRGDLVASIDSALEHGRDSGRRAANGQEALRHLARLSVRQREIMEMVLAGNPSKNIAADLGISQRTVENHRAAIMHRTGAKSLPELARLAVAATALKHIDP
jgi:two-component system CheB/CheR fusion protein